MTNNWTDLANSTCFVVMGANPAENHPASMAHINRARAGGNGHPPAKLIVVDPRKTRTAAQADVFVRIRPGTDIAFINGVTKYVIDNLSGFKKTNFENYLNQKSDRTFQADDGTTTTVLSTHAKARSKYTDARLIINAGGTDYERITFTNTDSKVISGFPDAAATYNASGVDTVYNKLVEQLAPYDTATVADICGCTEADIITVANAYLDNSRFASYATGTETTIINDPKNANYRSITMLYAMGLTQHTVGAQNVKSYAVLQTLLGNMGRPGGGINALRGIHNVQGSTDMGLLYHLIPGYSGNPTTQPTADANAFGKYMDALYGFRLSGGTNPYDNAYIQSTGFLQDEGFYNMNLAFFGVPGGLTNTATDRPKIDKIFSLWPKVNGTNHIQMFRDMQGGSPITKGCVVWGQNPAVTEPNQSEVRDGLKNLNTLVCVDMFENETAACDRKPSGVTYLFPACSHVEEAGSVTNSGRVLQWRERATLPMGNSMSDIELLLRFAKALDTAGAFSHITAAWATLGPSSPGSSAFDVLYANQYAGGWDPTTNNFETAVSMANVEVWPAFDSSGDPVDTGAKWSALPVGERIKTVYGSEAVCERIYREMATNVADQSFTAGGGTIWIYTRGHDGSPGAPGTGQGGGWVVANRAKSRDNSDGDTGGGGHFLYKNWGYAWLVNRRVLYNNGDTPWDQTDGFQGPDQCARLFVSTNAGLIDYSRNYRTIHRLADKPDTCLAGYVPPHVLTGRFPGHCEPYETPREDLAGYWGRNTTSNNFFGGGASTAFNLMPPDTNIAAPGGTHDPGEFPYVLTTIRCVEHFQGGPITRNNPWNVEAEPEPWVEINSLDAAAEGIKTGDLVNVITARSNSTSDQNGITVEIGAGGPYASSFAQGFRARVGVGLASNQRVGRGVVAIPWHWGDKGLSTGSRANDLCIDAGDANTTIPESKACLCKIVKL